MKVQRSISYTTSDDQVFTDRIKADAHETTLTVRQRLAGFFRNHLSPEQKTQLETSLDTVLEVMIGAAEECRDVLSFRAAKREMRGDDAAALNQTLQHARARRPAHGSRHASAPPAHRKVG